MFLVTPVAMELMLLHTRDLTEMGQETIIGPLKEIRILIPARMELFHVVTTKRKNKFPNLTYCSSRPSFGGRFSFFVSLLRQVTPSPNYARTISALQRRNAHQKLREIDHVDCKSSRQKTLRNPEETRLIRANVLHQLVYRTTIRESRYFWADRGAKVQGHDVRTIQGQLFP